MISKEKVFRSRISVLILVILLIPIISVTIFAFHNNDTNKLYIIMGLFIFIMFILTGIRYIIAENKLLIKIWFIPFTSININDISSIKRSYNPLSSPAASLKRLALYKMERTEFLYSLISPIKEDEFIDELKKINPQINIIVPKKGGLCYFWNWDI